MVPYADLYCRTTYLERWDCISLLDRPISDSMVLLMQSDNRSLNQTGTYVHSRRVDRFGGKLEFPAFINDRGIPKYPGGYHDYIVNHNLRGYRTGGFGQMRQNGKGAVNPSQLDRYIENDCFWRHEFKPSERYFKHSNQGYLEKAVALGFIGKKEQIILQIYSEPLQKFRLAAEGHGNVAVPDSHRVRVAKYLDPLTFWYPPLEEDSVSSEEYPMHALTQRPMAMYHSWGSQNAWLRQFMAIILYQPKRRKSCKYVMMIGCSLLHIMAKLKSRSGSWMEEKDMFGLGMRLENAKERGTYRKTRPSLIVRSPKSLISQLFPQKVENIITATQIL